MAWRGGAGTCSVRSEILMSNFHNLLLKDISKQNLLYYVLETLLEDPSGVLKL